MARLTMTLLESLYRSFKEAAAVREKAIEQLIYESLDFAVPGHRSLRLNVFVGTSTSYTLLTNRPLA